MITHRLTKNKLFYYIWLWCGAAQDNKAGGRCSTLYTGYVPLLRPFVTPRPGAAAGVGGKLGVGVLIGGDVWCDRVTCNVIFSGDSVEGGGCRWRNVWLNNSCCGWWPLYSLAGWHEVAGSARHHHRGAQCRHIHNLHQHSTGTLLSIIDTELFTVSHAYSCKSRARL